MQTYRKKLALRLTASLAGLKRPPLWAGFIAAAGVSLVLLWFLLVVLPNRNVPLIVNENTKRRADLINSNRENVLKVIQTIAALGFIVPAYLTWRNSQLTEDKNVTDRFAKAVEMLADKKLEMRLGGIYSLERIARDSKEDHSVVMEILAAFIREKAARAPDPDPMIDAYYEYEPDYDGYEPNPPEQDIQSALTVIGRRNVSSDGNQLQINLYRTNLDKADLSGINLQRAKIRSVSLRSTLLPEAMLNNSDFEYAKLQYAQLQGAFLSSAKLYRANLIYADLSNANLSEASLENTNLSCADLSNANLSEASLENANLSCADLKATILIGVSLHEANLKDIKWNEYTDWDNVKGLDTARNVPEKLKQKLGLTSLKPEEA